MQRAEQRRQNATALLTEQEREAAWVDLVQYGRKDSSLSDCDASSKDQGQQHEAGGYDADVGIDIETSFSDLSISPQSHSHHGSIPENNGLSASIPHSQPSTNSEDTARLANMPHYCPKCRTNLPRDSFPRIRDIPLACVPHFVVGHGAPCTKCLADLITHPGQPPTVVGCPFCLKAWTDETLKLHLPEAEWNRLVEDRIRRTEANVNSEATRVRVRSKTVVTVETEEVEMKPSEDLELRTPAEDPPEEGPKPMKFSGSDRQRQRQRHHLQLLPDEWHREKRRMDKRGLYSSQPP